MTTVDGEPPVGRASPSPLILPVGGTGYLARVDFNSTIIAGLITGGFAFVAVMVGNLLNRRAAEQAERWRHREESLRMLRWGSEQAVSADPATSRMGQAVLEALYDSADLLQPIDRPLFDAVQTAVLRSQIADDLAAYHEGDEFVYDDDATDQLLAESDQAGDQPGAGAPADGRNQ